MFKEYLLIDKHHYIKALPRGCSNIFSIFVEGVLIGVACYGCPVGRWAEVKYGKGTLELKRFCLDSGLPKNTASWFMAKCNRALKKKGVKKILSYADPTQGHEGIIYQASNFIYLGQQRQGTAYVLWKGKKVYYRNYSNDSRYPRALPIKYMIPKHIYVLNMET